MRKIRKEEEENGRKENFSSGVGEEGTWFLTVLETVPLVIL